MAVRRLGEWLAAFVDGAVVAAAEQCEFVATHREYTHTEWPSSEWPQPVSEVAEAHRRRYAAASAGGHIMGDDRPATVLQQLGEHLVRVRDFIYGAIKAEALPQSEASELTDTLDFLADLVAPTASDFSDIYSLIATAQNQFSVQQRLLTLNELLSAVPRTVGGGTPARAAIVSDLHTSIDWLLQELMAHAFRGGLDERAFVKAISDATQRLAALRGSDEVRRIRDEVMAAAVDVRTAVGFGGREALSEHFHTIAWSEKTQAERWRLGVLGAVLAIPVISLALGGPPATLSDWARKAAFAIPLAALAAYAGRQSNDHRSVARWAGIVSAQLRTLGAYTRGMDEDAARDLRQRLGDGLFDVRMTEAVNLRRYRRATDGSEKRITEVLQELSELLRVAKLP